MHSEYKFTNTYYWDYIGNTRNYNGLWVTKPIAPQTLCRWMPNAKAIRVDFSNNNFSKHQIDDLAYLNEILAIFNLKYLGILGSNQITKIPDSLLKQQLKAFEIGSCHKLIDVSIIGQSRTLESVSIDGFPNIPLGIDFYQLPKLKSLKINAREINDLYYLPKLKTLEFLEIQNLILKKLPEELAYLPQLKTLHLNSLIHLETLPDFKHFQQLQKLSLWYLPNLKSFPNDFNLLNKLEEVACRNSGNLSNGFDFPASILQLKQLKELTISDCNIQKFPDVFPVSATLDLLHLSNLSIEKLPSSIKNLTLLQDLLLGACKKLSSLNQAIKHLKNLKNLRLEGLPMLTSLDFDFLELPSLATLSLKYLAKISQLPRFDIANKSLSKIEIRNLPILKCLPVSLSNCQQLTELYLYELPINTIPTEYEQLTTLTSFSIDNCLELDYLPSNLIILGKEKLNINKAKFQKDTVITYRNLIVFMRKKIPIHLHTTVAYWLFDNFQQEPLTSSIKNQTLALLGYSNSDLHLLIFKNLHRLNENRIKLKDVFHQKGTVGILGTTQNKKTILRKELAALGFIYHPKIKETTAFILVGKKPKIAPEFWQSKRVLFSETEFTAFQENKNPGLLQKKDTPKEYIENIRRLIWSTDPANELIALELVVNQGLPKGLDMDFIIAAKTSKDQKVRQKIRKYLKGNLSDNALKVLNDRRVMNQYSGPFSWYQSMVSKKEIAQMLVTFYKRFGRGQRDFFYYTDGNSPYRADMVAGLSTALMERPKYIDLRFDYTDEEINKILSNGMVEGKIEDLRIHSALMTKIPTEIFKHKTIKRLELTGAFEATVFPEDFFKLKRLKYLQLQWKNLEVLPQELGKLKQLRDLVINANCVLELPDSFSQLTKLTRVYFSGGMKNKTTWEAKMPTIKF